MKKILTLVSLFLISNLATAAETKDWTILVFLNGNNNLDSFGAMNINQMEQVADSDKVNVVVQWASLDNGTTKRVLVKHDNDPHTVTSPTIEDAGKVDMGDYRSLEDFVRWGMEKYPAKHYFVDVWDHGAGWHLKNLRNSVQIRDISFDDNTGNSITTKQLGLAMQNIAKFAGKKIEIYGSDACLMAMGEVAGEMENAVDYFIGSEETEPGAGWPYDKFLNRLVANPSMSARELSTALTEEYTLSYSGGSNGSQDVTLSTLDLSKYNDYTAAVRNLGDAISRSPESVKGQILEAAKGSLSFAYSDYVDLGDFLAQIEAKKLANFDPRVITEAKAALDSFVAVNRVNGSFRGKAFGVSIWLPKWKYTFDSYIKKYQGLDFDTDTRWSTALTSFVKN